MPLSKCWQCMLEHICVRGPAFTAAMSIADWTGSRSHHTGHTLHMSGAPASVRRGCWACGPRAGVAGDRSEPGLTSAGGCRLAICAHAQRIGEPAAVRLAADVMNMLIYHAKGQPHAQHLQGIATRVRRPAAARAPRNRLRAPGGRACASSSRASGRAPGCGASIHCTSHCSAGERPGSASAAASAPPSARGSRQPAPRVAGLSRLVDACCTGDARRAPRHSGTPAHHEGHAPR